ncbi:LANO_0F02498g1_1 [Lachancea nothofagi CBS 11611]|uniref:LANO_0F02498g1_1 n=1 Tax=Lachancea nothofagi CBS 11611 TaxID=1266666 RepID=A0A1G4K6T6_9SACH|nr:LANO_0F02498g1_1 [Lachancea nothofagi CBS 11611]
MRVSEKLQKNLESSETSKPTFSFEFFVPKTTQGVQNLYDRMDRMYQTRPQFIDITWNAGGKLSQLSTDLVSTSQSVLGLETCMHLTCTNMPVQLIDDALARAYESGCQNILALRGDPPVTTGEWKQCEGGFAYAKDLVCYIRQKYGDHFDIGVAGYPEGHPEEEATPQLIQYLKEKVDAGANFIITQMFYDADIFIEWCRQVRQAGIDVPIIPGIMPITTYAAFMRRADWCKIKIPDEFMTKLDAVKDDDQAVREVGTGLIAGMCQKLLKSGYVTHLHMYTMNLEKASMMILDKLGLLTEEDDIFRDEVVPMPWRKSLHPQRRNESVRPIFWQKRPYSYVARTSQWSADEFPNGRFGDSSSPAFGDLDLLGSSLIRQSPQRALELWSAPTKLSDITNLVIDYLQGKTKCLPWCDVALNHEVDSIMPQLLDLNSHEILTLNSQPRVNGLPSGDKVIGWGPNNGYVFQKEYLEFLLPKSKLPQFMDLIGHDASLTYFSVDASDQLHSNHPDDTAANAVTWGIFPGREVLQPTIVEKVSFLAWKEEFFHILEEWKLILGEQGHRDSVTLLDTIINDYTLVNVVDNDFVTDGNRIHDHLKCLY